jgi:hypothetical protein
MTVKVPSLLDQVCRRIDQDGKQTREVVGLAMQKEKASLRRNRNAHLICDFETVATFKTFFGQKNLNVAEKLGLILGSKPLKKCNVALDRRQPIIWKKCGPQAVPSPLL